MIGNLLSKGTAELVKNVGGVIDNLHTSAEEKLDALESFYIPREE